MTDDEDNNNTDNDLYDVTEEEITISREELSRIDDNLDALAYGLHGFSEERTVTGTFSIESTSPEFTADVTITDNEGNIRTLENATIKSQEQVRKEAYELRANAPPEYDLCDRTADIDDVIRALQQAKERGVREVYVNDDGMTRSPDPRITNNHVRYYGHSPEPGELEEWVEL